MMNDLKAGSRRIPVLVIAMAASMALAQGSGTKSDRHDQGSSTKASEPADPPQVRAELNAQALRVLLDARVPLILLDARGDADDPIRGARALAHDADAGVIQTALPRKDALIVTYCGGPECPMSLMLANRLAQMGYSHVIRFTGGVEAWREAGLAEAPRHDDGHDHGSATKEPPAQHKGSSSKGSGTR